MSYRPITDVWLLAHPRPFKDGTRWHGAYPLGFLQRARDLLGVHISDPVLHVCSGAVRKYPYAGFGPADRTMDIDPETGPDIVHDAREPFPLPPWAASKIASDDPEYLELRRKSDRWDDMDKWKAILMDPPYDEADAGRYREIAHAALPSPGRLLRNACAAIRIGGRIGMLHFKAPSHSGLPLRLVADVMVQAGANSQARCYLVWEKTELIHRAKKSPRKAAA